MKISCRSALAVLFALLFALPCKAVAAEVLAAPAHLYFTENKGQVRDQHGHPRADVDFVLQSPGVTVFIGKGQLHYQFFRPVFPAGFLAEAAPGTMPLACNANFDINMYRMDVELLGANKNAACTPGGWNAYHETYYLHGAEARARTCTSIVYKDVYPGIDWVLYIKDNTLEHGFLLAAGASVEQVRLTYHGATSLRLTADGGLCAATPMGTVREHAPACYAGTAKVPSAFVLSGNTLSYNVAPYSGPLLIDPAIHWGTYYGVDTANFSGLHFIATDAQLNVYAGGKTTSAYATSIVTTGSFQSVYAGGSYDTYIVKFDSGGHRLWATYYGGDGYDDMSGVRWHPSGCLYVYGATGSTTGLTTPGCQQPLYGGGSYDAFIARFDTAGNRTWATYCGGSGDDGITVLCHDTTGHIYMCGFTTSPDNIATPGSFMPAYVYRDLFLAKYDIAGNKVWGTYYGGDDGESGGSVCTDGLNVYLVGITLSDTGISTPGSHQPAAAGAGPHPDGFVAKFDSGGHRQWATYYGGALADYIEDIACNRQGDLLIVGHTYSDTGIATPASAQPSLWGTRDGFLLKMSAAGSRLWARYIGGPGVDAVVRLALDTSGNICISGGTDSDTAIAAPDAWHTTLPGTGVVYDCFIGFLNDTGSYVWGTYFAGPGTETIDDLVHDGRSYYICGRTNSTTGIGTPGAHQPTTTTSFWMANMGYLLKFGYPDTTSSDTTVYATQTVAGTQLLSVYPNPNNGTFTVAVPATPFSGPADVVVSDLFGRTVWRATLPAPTRITAFPITLRSDLPAGAYLINLKTPHTNASAHFLKE